MQEPLVELLVLLPELPVLHLHIAHNLGLIVVSTLLAGLDFVGKQLHRLVAIILSSSIFFVNLVLQVC